MKCLNCGNEFQSKRATARFCSDKCRLAFNYKKVSVEKVSVESDKLDVTKLTKDELYTAINSYPTDTWKDSEEHAELMRRLKKKYPPLKEQARA